MSVMVSAIVDSAVAAAALVAADGALIAEAAGVGPEMMSCALGLCLARPSHHRGRPPRSLDLRWGMQPLQGWDSQCQRRPAAHRATVQSATAERMSAREGAASVPIFHNFCMHIYAAIRYQ